MRTRNSRFGVLVGIDGSAESRSAVHWALDTAARHDLPLTVVHVLREPENHCTAWGLTSAPKSVRSNPQVEHDAEALVGSAISVIDHLADATPLGYLRTKLHAAPTAATLADLSGDADMVVVGGTEHHLASPTLWPSIGIDLARHASCPVAVVRGEARIRPCALPVVVGIDGSSASEAAVAIAFDEAASRDVELVALCVVKENTTLELSGTMLAPDTAGQEVLAERLAGWAEQYPDVNVRPLVAWGDPAQRLLEEAETSQLLVVGSHGRNTMASAVLGSVSSAVVSKSPVPVIIGRQP
ncbi:universal stress protein [Mycolicibacterium aubagnense]|uniref:Universal stress protein n=1 Tax=Mycolicibacterium aubagnense TaxID=319707 RepID=A0ABN5YML1_9MYCO|nr:universal stress protein [Mycolicibacterium aubagnense]TLH63992.1 universal stress protein [Mycolicibacterium aubagnense]WGI35074.1 universal stress protein [Mycolicibacterium aubagnense]BBX82992.1 universal stress protein [Mycolicibacterium aubagnense]